MFAGDNSCLSKDRNRRRLSLAKIGQRLSGSARETASRKRSTLIGDPGRHGYRSHGHETAQALETTCPAHAEVASKTKSCQPLFLAHPRLALGRKPQRELRKSAM